MLMPQTKRRPQAVLQAGDLSRRFVAADDNLLVGLVKRVEGMEKFFLNLFFAGDELHVVDDQDIGGAVEVR